MTQQLDQLAIVFWPGSRGDFLATFLLDHLNDVNCIRPNVDYDFPYYCKIHPVATPRKFGYEVCRGFLNIDNRRNRTLTSEQWTTHAKAFQDAGRPVIRILIKEHEVEEVVQLLWAKAEKPPPDSNSIESQLIDTINNVNMDQEIWPYYAHFISWEDMFNMDALIDLYGKIHSHRHAAFRKPSSIMLERAKINIEIQKQYLGRKK